MNRRTTFSTYLESALLTPRRELLRSVVTMVLAVLLTIACIRLLLGEPMPVFGILAVLVILQPPTTSSPVRALERTAGVALGVVLSLLFVQFVDDDSWAVAGVVVLALLAAWCLRLSPGTGNQMAVSVVLVLALGATIPHYAVLRVVETAIGAVLAVAVAQLSRRAEQRLTAATGCRPQHRAGDGQPDAGRCEKS